MAVFFSSLLSSLLGSREQYVSVIIIPGEMICVIDKSWSYTLGFRTVPLVLQLNRKKNKSGISAVVKATRWTLIAISNKHFEIRNYVYETIENDLLFTLTQSDIAKLLFWCKNICFRATHESNERLKLQPLQKAYQSNSNDSFG